MDWIVTGQRAVRTAHRVFSEWFFGDLLYAATIPIGVLALIGFLSGKLTWTSFLGLREWAFADVVLFGVGARDFVNLKVNVQRAGSYALTVKLIAFSIILAVSVLDGEGGLAQLHREGLVRAQTLLFMTAALLGFACSFTNEHNTMPLLRPEGPSGHQDNRHANGKLARNTAVFETPVPTTSRRSGASKPKSRSTTACHR